MNMSANAPDMVLMPSVQPDKNSPVPLYFQIAQGISEVIRSGELVPGQRLPNEFQLSEQLGVSRPTVRQAVHQLVQQGLLIRQRGVGTIVAGNRIPRSMALTSLFDDLAASQREPVTKVLSFAYVLATQEMAAELSVSPGDRLLFIERLRSADGSPLAIMTNYLPAALLDNSITAEDLENSGLYQLLRKQGVQLRAAEQTITARRATAREANLLGVSRTATMLTMTRLAYDTSGKPVEYGSHAYLAERYSMRVSLVSQ